MNIHIASEYEYREYLVFKSEYEYEYEYCNFSKMNMNMNMNIAILQKRI